VAICQRLSEGSAAVLREDQQMSTYRRQFELFSFPVRKHRASRLADAKPRKRRERQQATIFKARNAKASFLRALRCKGAWYCIDHDDMGNRFMLLRTHRERYAEPLDDIYLIAFSDLAAKRIRQETETGSIDICAQDMATIWRMLTTRVLNPITESPRN